MESTAMQFVVWVETIIAGQSVAVQRAAVVDRQCLANVPTKLGLTLQEGRAILTGIEQDVVQSQVELQSGAHSWKTSHQRVANPHLYDDIFKEK
jgi:hypothetical protein